MRAVGIRQRSSAPSPQFPGKNMGGKDEVKVGGWEGRV